MTSSSTGGAAGGVTELYRHTRLTRNTRTRELGRHERQERDEIEEQAWDTATTRRPPELAADGDSGGDGDGDGDVCEPAHQMAPMATRKGLVSPPSSTRVMDSCGGRPCSLR